MINFISSSTIINSYCNSFSKNSSLLTLCIVQKCFVNPYIDQKYDSKRWANSFKILSFASLAIIDRIICHYKGTLVAHGVLISVALAVCILRKSNRKKQANPTPRPQQTIHSEVKPPNSLPPAHPNPKAPMPFYKDKLFEKDQLLPSHISVDFHNMPLVTKSLDTEIILDQFLPKVLSNVVLDFLNVEGQFNEDIFNLAVLTKEPGRLVNYIEDFDKTPMVDSTLDKIIKNKDYADNIIRLFFKLNTLDYWGHQDLCNQLVIRKTVTVPFLFKRMTHTSKFIIFPVGADLSKIKRLFTRSNFSSNGHQKLRLLGKQKEIGFVLEGLSKSKKPIRKITLRSKCPSLQSFEIFLNGVSANSLKEIFFKEFEISSQMLRILINSRAWRSIETLNFKSSILTEGVAETLFNRQTDLSNLKRLTLGAYHEKETNAYRPILAIGNSDLSNLEYLSLYGMLSELSNLNFPNLRTLKLSNAAVTDQFLLDLGNSKGLPKLEVLDFRTISWTSEVSLPGIINFLRTPLGSRLKAAGVPFYDYLGSHPIEEVLLPALGKNYSLNGTVLKQNSYGTVIYKNEEILEEKYDFDEKE